MSGDRVSGAVHGGSRRMASLCRPISEVISELGCATEANTQLAQVRGARHGLCRVGLRHKCIKRSAIIGVRRLRGHQPVNRVD